MTTYLYGGDLILGKYTRYMLIEPNNMYAYNDISTVHLEIQQSAHGMFAV